VGLRAASHPDPLHLAQARPGRRRAVRDAAPPGAGERRTRRRTGCFRRAGCADPAWGPAGAAGRPPSRRPRRRRRDVPAGRRCAGSDGRRADPCPGPSARPGRKPPAADGRVDRAADSDGWRRVAGRRTWDRGCRRRCAGAPVRVFPVRRPRARPGVAPTASAVGREPVRPVGRASGWAGANPERARHRAALRPSALRRDRGCRPCGAGHRDGYGHRHRRHRRPWIRAGGARPGPRRWRREISRTPRGPEACSGPVCC
jgi:hypothetical protein